jgi:hypothetical protein
MRVILLVARNSHTKQSGKVHCHDAEDNPPNSIFSRHFHCIFPHSVVMLLLNLPIISEAQTGNLWCSVER